MEIDEEELTAPLKPLVVTNVSSKEFDLESYISNYSGHTKLVRLIFIAEHCKDLELEAYKMAIEEIKRTTNTTLYRELIHKLGPTISSRLGPAFAVDQVWVEGVERRAQQQLERLELELNSSKQNLIKESIRVGHNDLGDYYYNRGDLNNSLKSYVRSRDYCTTSKHIIQMCLNVIRVSIEMGNYAHVLTYVGKAEQTPDLQDQVVIAKLKCCAGLAHLEGKKYKMAARKFLETSFELDSNFTDVISPQDVAIYGGLCGLATFDRSELKKLVIDNSPFKNFLELVPEVRELIQDFYYSRYASCLNYLEKLKAQLQLDMYLHVHVDQLYSKIRNKALIQYFSPFVSVDLNTMAQAFNTNEPALEKELAALILEGSIQARIDSHNKRLYARHTDQREATFQNALKTGEDFQNNAKVFLLRANLLRGDFVVRPPRRDDRDK